MTLASRLKRLGDRLKSEATRVYQENGVDFNDSWFLVAVVLSRQESASVSDMAESLDVSHAAISQMARAMERSGLITSENDVNDRRRSLLRLTDKGRETVKALEPLWRLIGDVTDELVEGTGNDLLETIAGMEDQLRERSLFERVSDQMAARPARKKD
jgi:DNA-binding MarR family transcriptional regulator